MGSIVFVQSLDQSLHQHPAHLLAAPQAQALTPATLIQSPEVARPQTLLHRNDALHLEHQPGDQGGFDGCWRSRLSLQSQTVGFHASVQQGMELRIHCLQARHPVFGPEQSPHDQRHEDADQGVEAAIEHVGPIKLGVGIDAQEHHRDHHSGGQSVAPAQTSQEGDGDQQAHENADPAGHDRVHQKGDQAAGDRPQDPSTCRPQAVLILVIDDEGDREQRIPGEGDAVKVLCDCTGDQDAQPEPEALSQQVPVHGSTRLINTGTGDADCWNRWRRDRPGTPAILCRDN